MCSCCKKNNIKICKFFDAKDLSRYDYLNQIYLKGKVNLEEDLSVENLIYSSRQFNDYLS